MDHPYGLCLQAMLSKCLPCTQTLSPDNPASCNFAEDFQRLVARAQKLIIAAQQRHKRYYDAKHVPAVFVVNDEVLLSTAGLNLKISGTIKLAPK